MRIHELLKPQLTPETIKNLKEELARINILQEALWKLAQAHDNEIANNILVEGSKSLKEVTNAEWYIAQKTVTAFNDILSEPSQ